MTELKPCPFCGGEAEPFNPFGNINGPWYVRCSDCGGSIRFEHTEAEAIAAWNTRADDYRQAAEYWQRMYEETFARRTFRMEGDGECEKLPSLTDAVCIVRRGGMEMHFGYWRCSKCGCENFEGAKYCMNCGAKVIA